LLLAGVVDELEHIEFHLILNISNIGGQYLKL
jgi:hypothetical protein